MNSSRYNPGLKKSSLVQKENYRGLLSVMPVVLMELAAC